MLGMKKHLLAFWSGLVLFFRYVWAKYSLLIKYGAGLGVLAWFITTNWAGIVMVVKVPWHWTPLVLAVVINAVSLVITFTRWYFLVRAQDLPFKVADAIRLGLFGLFWSTFLPGSITGDIPKAGFLAKEQSRRSVAVGTIIMDRVVGLCGLFWLVAVLGTIFWVTGELEQMVPSAQGQWILKAILFMSLGVVLGSLTFWFVLGLFAGSYSVRLIARIESIAKIGHSLAELGRAALMYRVRGRAVLLALVMSMVAHVGFVSTFYLCSLTLFQRWQSSSVPIIGASSIGLMGSTPGPGSLLTTSALFAHGPEIPSAQTHFLIVPVGMTIQAGIPTPGGLGGGEYAYGKLYKLVDSSFFEGFMASLMQRVLGWGLAVVGILVYLFMKPATAKTAAVENETVAARER